MARHERGRLDDLDAKGFFQGQQILITGHDEIRPRGQSTRKKNRLFSPPGAPSTNFSRDRAVLGRRRVWQLIQLFEDVAQFSDGVLSKCLPRRIAHRF